MNFPNDTRLLECRHCNAANRVPLERALRQPGSLRCGRCKRNLLLEREARWTPPADDSGPGGPAGYQHPLDRQTLAAVQQIPGVDTLLKKLIENTWERYSRMFHLSSFVQVTDRQLPTLHRQFEKAAFALGIDAVPDLYLYADPGPNAYTSGVERPYVALSTALVDIMDDDEVFAVMAHELSHWQCRHVLYKTATRLLVEAASAVATYTFGLGGLVILPVRMALLKWDRCSELSADRGMLLATRDIELSMRVLFKLAGGSVRFKEELSLDRFLEQAERARQAPEESVLDRAFSLLQTVTRTHPFPLWRAAELWTWACDGEYLQLLQSGTR